MPTDKEKETIIDILKAEPEITTADIDMKDSDDFINMSLELLSSIAAGGKSDKGIQEYASDQVNKGLSVESEHTPEKVIQKEIVKDHLEEDPKYYDHLKEMEDKYSSISCIMLNSRTACVKIPEDQYTGEATQIHKLAEYAGQYGRVINYAVEHRDNLAHVMFRVTGA